MLPIKPDSDVKKKQDSISKENVGKTCVKAREQVRPREAEESILKNDRRSNLQMTCIRRSLSLVRRDRQSLSLRGAVIPQKVKGTLTTKASEGMLVRRLRLSRRRINGSIIFREGCLVRLEGLLLET